MEKKKNWEGPVQYEDQTGDLMMLPTDLALILDSKFKVWVEKYADSLELFNEHFAKAFSKLLSNGAPKQAQYELTGKQKISSEFREASMHGSYDVVKKLAPDSDVHELEATSGRSALHKAAYWDHSQTIGYLLETCKLNPNVQDYNGDTALHDAARFGHQKSIEYLLPVTDVSLKNKDGKTALDLAKQYDHPKALELINSKL